MNEDLTRALTTAVTEALGHLEPLKAQWIEPYQEWRRTGDGCWQWDFVEGPSFMGLFGTAGTELDDLGTRFNRLLFQSYPAYKGMVGTPSTGRATFLRSPSSLLTSLVYELWKRRATFLPSSEQIAQVVQEFANFLDSPTLRLTCMAQLDNFQMDAESLALPCGITIRRLTDKEATEFYGGSLFHIANSRPPLVIQEYVMVADIEERKSFDYTHDATPAVAELRANFSKVIMALRTFKKGKVGYDTITFRTNTFCPLLFPSLTYHDLLTPPGRFHLSAEEIEPFLKYASYFFSPIHPALELGASRLADAETRTNPRDSLLDAAIGLEAILLYGTGKEEYRGELKFRFSLNYSTLFSGTAARRDSFREAKSLYDVRSGIAHGASPDEDVNWGKQKIKLSEASDRACTKLRKVLHQFLPSGNKPPFSEGVPYWEKAYFGMFGEDEDGTPAAPHE